VRGRVRVRVRLRVRVRVRPLRLAARQVLAYTIPSVIIPSQSQ
jgi:hypothetical protein